MTNHQVVPLASVYASPDSSRFLMLLALRLRLTQSVAFLRGRPFAPGMVVARPSSLLGPYLKNLVAGCHLVFLNLCSKLRLVLAQKYKNHQHVIYRQILE